jgi:nicotinate phosphoribosyltransferase
MTSNRKTSRGQSALDGVYKLVAICRDNTWAPAIKISESLDKIINPGHKSVWRVYNQRGNADADLLSLRQEDPRSMQTLTMHHPMEYATQRVLEQSEISEIEALLVPVLEDGKLIYELPSIEQMRERRVADIERLDPGVRRIMNPHIYHVSLTEALWQLKQELIEKLMESTDPESA